MELETEKSSSQCIRFVETVQYVCHIAKISANLCLSQDLFAHDGVRIRVVSLGESYP
jgi:hypothetical protein